MLSTTLKDVESLVEKLMVAVDQHNVENMELWLGKLRAQPDGEDAVQDMVQAFDLDGNTLLHRCAISGVSGQDDVGKVIETLVSLQADVNNSNLLGETPLLAACRSSFPSPGLISALLEARAEASRPDSIASETALMEVACRGDAQLSRLLLEHRADASARNSHGRTAMDLAIENRHSTLEF